MEYSKSLTAHTSVVPGSSEIPWVTEGKTEQQNIMVWKVSSYGKHLRKPLIPQLSAAPSVLHHDQILPVSFFPGRELHRQGNLKSGHWAIPAEAPPTTPPTVKEKELVGDGEGLSHDQLRHLRYGRMASWLWNLFTGEKEKKLHHSKVYEKPRMR